MPDNDTRSNNGQGAVRLKNDRICVFERNGVYQARIRTEANRYLWRSLKTRNQTQAISAARKLFHSIEFRQQSGLPLANRSVNRAIDEYVTLRERQQTQGRTSFHMLRQIKRVVNISGIKASRASATRNSAVISSGARAITPSSRRCPRTRSSIPQTKHCSGK